MYKIYTYRCIYKIYKRYIDSSQGKPTSKLYKDKSPETTNITGNQGWIPRCYFRILRTITLGTLAQVTQRKLRHFDTRHWFGSSNQETVSMRHRRYFYLCKEFFSITEDTFPPTRRFFQQQETLFLPPTRRFLQQQLYSRNYKLFIQKDFSTV